MLVGFCESNGQTWTIDLEMAKKMNSLSPVYHYYGHLAELLKSSAKFTPERIDVEINKNSISKFDVLIIAHPASDEYETNVGGSPTFSAKTIQAIAEFVREGGGLLLIGEYHAESWGSNINDLAVQFGFTFNNDTVASKGDDNAQLLVRHFLSMPQKDHPITSALGAVSYHRGCSISRTGENSFDLLKSPDDQLLSVASEFGSGRVIGIGDSDLFSIPFLGGHDNALFFVRAIQWLARSSDSSFVSGDEVRRFVSSSSFQLLERTHNSDLADVPGDHVIDCGPYEGDLVEVARSANERNPYTEGEDFRHLAEMGFHRLPLKIRQEISRFRRYGNEYGVLLLRGLTTDPVVPATPSDSRRSQNKESHISEFWLSLVGMALGDPMSYIQEKDGELYHNICPVRGLEAELSSESSDSLLDFHTETAFHPIMPDFVLLYCLRPDHAREARTICASTRHMIERLPLSARSILFERIFRTGIDFSFLGRSAEPGNGPVFSVFYGNADDPFMRFDLDLMETENSEGAKALELMKSLANETKNWVHLSEGDLLIIDNRRAVHGRSSFTPRYDGMDRWLQRLYVVRDLAYCTQERHESEQRLIATIFGD